MIEPELHLRPAAFDDWALLLSWRNDPVTRSGSHHAEPVREDHHKEWLKGVLEDPERKLFVALLRDEPVGSCRADHDAEAHELSWTVAPSARGRGIGTRMVKALAVAIGGRLRAEVKEGNPASGRIAVAAGLTLREQVGETLHYRNYEVRAGDGSASS